MLAVTRRPGFERRVLEERVVARVVFEQPRGDQRDDLVRGGAAAVRGIDADRHGAGARADHGDLHPPVALHARHAEHIQIPDVVVHDDGQWLVRGPQLTFDVHVHLSLQ